MNSVKITGFIYATNSSFAHDKPYFTFCESDMTSHGWIKVAPVAFDVAIPADFNFQAAKIAALEALKEKARHDFQARMAELTEQISKLQALEFVAPQPADGVSA